MSLQSVFDMAAKRLIAQGKPAWNSTGFVCMYRTDFGEVCAVGALMTEEELSVLRKDGQLGTTFNGLPNEIKDRLLGEVGRDGEFLAHLQRAHDGAEKETGWLRNFKERMVELAQKYNLNTDCLGELE